jgi:hypothetical protein
MGAAAFGQIFEQDYPTPTARLAQRRFCQIEPFFLKTTPS